MFCVSAVIDRQAGMRDFIRCEHPLRRGLMVNVYA